MLAHCQTKVMTTSQYSLNNDRHRVHSAQLRCIHVCTRSTVHLVSSHRLSLDHVAHSLIESVHLVRLQVTHNGTDVVEDLFNERHDLQWLNLHKVPPTFLGNLDKRITRHILYTIMSFWRDIHRERRSLRCSVPSLKPTIYNM